MRPTPPATVFNRSDARAYGWSDSALSRAVRAGRILRLKHDQFTTLEHGDDPRVVAAAAARSCQGSVVSHRSAALIYGLPLLHPAPARPDLTITPRATGDVAGALLHRATLRPEDVIEVDGIPVTTLARTLVDVGRCTSTAAAVVAIDAALHRNLIETQDLEEAVRVCRRWPGIRRARGALAVADARAESPLESLSRLVLRKLEVPVPELQATLCDENGVFLGRVDFYWPEPGVVGEADGLAKYDSRAVLLDEKRRQDGMEALGLVVVRWDWTEVTRRPQLLRQRLTGAFERGRRRDHAGFPRQWSVRAA
jgi:hypothetical protein